MLQNQCGNASRPGLAGLAILVMCSFGIAIQPAQAAGENADANKEVQSDIQTLNERVKKLEAERLYKVLSPYKDIDFLYDVVVGDGDYLFRRTDSECAKYFWPDDPSRAVGIRRKEWFWQPNELILKPAAPAKANAGEDLKSVPAKAVGAVPSVCKLEAVEEVLGITPKKEEDLKSRIRHAYEAINYPEWDSDSIRFGVMLGYVPDIEATSFAIALHAHPSYRRNIPGEIDLWRRLSFYVSVGGVSTADQANEVSGAAYSVGLAVELTRGVILTYGSVLYETGANSSNPDRYQSSGMWGITLSSELWARLISNSK